MNERVTITTDPVDIKRITGRHYEQFYANNFHNIDEIGKLLEEHYFQNGYKNVDSCTLYNH